MIQCKVCFATNPDSAVVCSVCKAPLDRSAGAKNAARRPTVPEDMAEIPSRRSTVFEDVEAHRPGGDDRQEQRDRGLGGSGRPARRVTIFDPSKVGDAGASDAGANAQGPETAKNVPAAKGRRIVGVLVTYSWSDQGQIFPVYEGRNRIGSDPHQCDIAIPQDDTLSAINSHIVYRKSFTIGDDVSMGGTDVNGEPVEVAFVPLHNYARIRTGSTHWTFIAVAPEEGNGGQ